MCKNSTCHCTARITFSSERADRSCNQAKTLVGTHSPSRTNSAQPELQHSPSSLLPPSLGVLFCFLLLKGEIRGTRTHTMDEATSLHVFTTATLEKFHKQEFCTPKSAPSSLNIFPIFICMDSKAGK